MISSVKAQKFLSKGCTCYLAHIINKVDETVPGVKETLMLCEFQDILLDSLTRLALKK